MKKILGIILLLLLTISLVGCNKEVNVQQVKSTTEEAWDNSTKNESVEQISFKNLNIGGVMKINNLVLDVEKKYDNGKFLVNIETRKNMSVIIDEKVKGIIDMVLDYKNLEGNLKVKHLEQAWSKVGLKVNFEATKDSIVGYVEFLNVKDMFKENMSKSMKIDINLKGEKNKQIVQSIYDELKAHPISMFVPSNKQSMNIGKETSVNCDTTHFCNLANVLFCTNCDKKMKDSDKTIEHILYDTFAETTGEDIVKKVLQISEPMAKYKLSTKDNKEYVSEVNFKSKININISKNQLDIAAKDLTQGEKKKELYNIFKSIIGIMNYDENFVTGELEVLVQNRIVK